MRSKKSSQTPSRGRCGGRLGRALALTVLFFAGGAVSALGGDVLVAQTSDATGASECLTSDGAETGHVTCQGVTSAPTTASTASTGSGEPATTAAEPASTVNEPSSGGDPAAQPPGSGSSQPVPTPDPGASGADGRDDDSDGGGKPAVVHPEEDAAGAYGHPEVSVNPGNSVLWLHSPLADPTPRFRRLQPAFAERLVRVSRRYSVGWPLLLGTLRANGHRGRIPASPARVAAVARALAAQAPRRPWAAVLAVFGSTAKADRAVAFARYNRAVGLEGLVRGLEAVKPALARRVLRDARIALYEGGHTDVAAGRVDVRVLVLLRYLRIAHGSVTVSSLVSGHRLFARPGVVSAHFYGRAVDVTALGGVSVQGNQAPGGLTERAIRNLLLLPSTLRPQQVISLLGLGGPSFPLADHGDHIHVGY